MRPGAREREGEQLVASPGSGNFQGLPQSEAGLHNSPAHTFRAGSIARPPLSSPTNRHLR